MCTFLTINNQNNIYILIMTNTTIIPAYITQILLAAFSSTLPLIPKYSNNLMCTFSLSLCPFLFLYRNNYDITYI